MTPKPTRRCTWRPVPNVPSSPTPSTVSTESVPRVRACDSVSRQPSGTPDPTHHVMGLGTKHAIHLEARPVGIEASLQQRYRFTLNALPYNWPGGLDVLGVLTGRGRSAHVLEMHRVLAGTWVVATPTEPVRLPKLRHPLRHVRHQSPVIRHRVTGSVQINGQTPSVVRPRRLATPYKARGIAPTLPRQQVVATPFSHIAQDTDKLCDILVDGQRHAIVAAQRHDTAAGGWRCPPTACVSESRHRLRRPQLRPRGVRRRRRSRRTTTQTHVSM